MIPFNKTEAVVAPVTEDDRWLGRYIDFIVKCTFEIGEDGAVTPLPVGDQPPIKGDEIHDDEIGRSVKYPSDVDPPKVLTDIVFAGSAHAPDGKPVERLEVGLGLGRWSKQLIVTGDREWRKNDLGEWRLSAPKPFTEMPMRWEKAYGGLMDPRNPCGRGLNPDLNPFLVPIGADPPPEMPPVPAPNIEYPGQLVRSIDDQPDPAGLGPVAPFWQPRDRLAGTRDQAWATTTAPRPPSDFDPRFHNAAPEDQQVKGLRGDESVVLSNLSARAETLSFRLPGLYPRVFYVEAADEDRSLNEIAMQLDTVFIDGLEHQVTLVWRARLEHAYDDPAEELDYMLAVWDTVGAEPRPVAAIHKEFVEEIPMHEEMLAVRKLSAVEIGAQLLVPAMAEMVKALTKAKADPGLISRISQSSDPEFIRRELNSAVHQKSAELEAMARATQAKYGSIDDEIRYRGGVRPPEV